MGRAGAFLALCICLERMKVENVVDVFQTVRTMRSQRPVMVNTTVSTPSTVVDTTLTFVITLTFSIHLLGLHSTYFVTVYFFRCCTVLFLTVWLGTCKH